MRVLARCVVPAVVVVVALLLLSGCRRARLLPAGPHVVDPCEATWHDAVRDRDVPIRCYLPGAVKGSAVDNSERCPVILLSHGLGGSRDGMSYLAEYWASHGYIVIAMTHHGSDTTVLRQRIREGGIHEEDEYEVNGSLEQSIANRTNRPLDLSFILDRIASGEDLPAELRGRVDFDRVGAAGHSYGAYTAMAIGGALVDFPDVEDRSFRDPRIRAVMAMSPQGPDGGYPEREPWGFDDRSWDPIEIPVFTLCGSEELPDWRGVPFGAMTCTPRYHLVLRDADHMAFSDSILGGRRDPRHHRWLQEVSLRFWDAHLRGDADAINYMQHNGLQPEAGAEAVIECRVSEDGN